MVSPPASQLRQAVQNHLYAHLGPAGEIETLEGSPLEDSPVQRLDLAFFLPEQHIPVAVFATMGAAAYEMGDGGRMEALMLCRPTPQREAFEPIHGLLSAFATHAEATQTVLDMGDVIPARELLAPISAMQAVLLLPPVPATPALAHLVLPGGTTIDLTWLMPVYDEEADFALREGPEQLMALFALEKLDPCDLARRPLDITRSVPNLGTVQEALGRGVPPRTASYTAQAEGGVIKVTRRGKRTHK